MVERGGRGKEFEDVGAHFGGRWWCTIDPIGAIGVGREGAVGADMVGAAAGAVGVGVLGPAVAVEEDGALGDGVADESVDACFGRCGDEGDALSLVRVGRVEGPFDFLLEGCEQGNGHDDLLGGHADLARMHERAVDAFPGREAQVRSWENDCRRFAAEFHQAGLQDAAGLLGDDAPHRGGACEVDLFDGRVRDQGRGHSGAVAGFHVDGVEHARWQAGFREDGGDGPEATWGALGALEDDGVASSEGGADGTHSEDVGGVPGGDAKDDSVGLFEDDSLAVGLGADWFAGGECGDDAAGDIAQYLNACGDDEACSVGRSALCLLIS